MENGFQVKERNSKRLGSIFKPQKQEFGLDRRKYKVDGSKDGMIDDDCSNDSSDNEAIKEENFKIINGGQEFKSD